MESVSEQSIRLTSSLELEILSDQKSDFQSWTIHCFQKSNSEENADAFIQAKKIYGELTAGQIYIVDAVSREAVALLNRSSVPALDNTKPGRRHVSFALGAALADLIKSRIEIFGKKSIVLNLENFWANTELCHLDDFLTAMRLRFVKNRLVRQTDAEKQVLTHLHLLVPATQKLSIESALRESKTLSEAMLWTKSLVNAPSNLLRPSSYERFVSAIVKELSEQTREQGPRIEMESFKGTDLTEMGCNLIAAVGRGSSCEPRLVKLTYRPSVQPPAGEGFKRVALVGKGITFDSGGYNLKPSASMRNMKKDMGGSAVALGAFVGIARLGLPIEIDCYLALAENMVSGNAFRPGDVLTARDGSLVEIDNTDAEGRLVLSDALHLAAETRPDWIIDFATLTGAARVALGGEVDALFSNEAEKALLVASSGIETGDWVWHLPRVPSYAKLLESSVADTLNCSPSGLGGAIIATQFMERFVGTNAWTHIDTYMWSDKPSSLTSPESGPTAKCVRLVIESLRRFCAVG